MKRKLLIFLLIIGFLITPYRVFSEENVLENENIETEEVLEEEPKEEEQTEETNEVEEEIKEEEPILKPSVSYTTHVQYIGWQKYVNDGTMAGTTGRSLRLEGIKIKLENANGNIEYRTHIQYLGWEKEFKKNDEISGTSGRSLRLEAIEMRLTGEISESYDVYYRVHAENFGWLGWAKNGEAAGTANYAYRLEGIEIILIPKDTIFEEYGVKTPFKTKHVYYTTHVQNIGWQDYVYDGNSAGTTGRSFRLEGIKIKINSEYEGNVEYRTHIQNIGWEKDFKKNDEMSGTSGKSLRLEAIEIKLTGEVSNHFDIYYRVHAENFGWLDWAKNGEPAGTAAYGYRLEAIQIKMVNKGESPPGKTERPFVEKIIGYEINGNYKYDGEMIGTIGKNLEPFSIKLIKKDYSGGIEYSTYTNNDGWNNTVSLNQKTNVSGKVIEAIKAKLTGDLANHYDIFYRTYISNTGWTGWATNDAPCGNVGFNKAVQAIQIKVIEKGKQTPTETSNTYVEEELKIQYDTYSSKWTGFQEDGAPSPKDDNKVIEKIRIGVNKKTLKGQVLYSTHTSDIGWQSYVSDFSENGKIGKRIEAIKIKLSGDLATNYDVYYRTYVKTVGWMGWTSNDKMAGTTGGGLPIQKIEIQLIKKGEEPPENTDNINTSESYLYARWETDEDGNKYFYDIYGEKVQGGSYVINNVTHYFGPTGIYLGTNHLEVIDISAHNGKIDWAAVSSSGIYGVILRVAAGCEKEDSRLAYNIEQVKKYNIPYGIYIYSYAENYSEGVLYAEFTKNVMNKYQMNPTLGVFLDLESNVITQFMGPTEYTAVVKGFLSIIPDAELYTYVYYADTALNTPYMRGHITWIAHYNTECRYTGSYKMWQYTSEGSVSGVTGDVDRSVLYSFK